MNQGGLRMQAMTQTSLDLVRVIQAVIVMFVAAPMLVKTVLPSQRAEKSALRNVTVGRSQPTPPRREPWHEPSIAFSPAYHL